MFVPGTLVQTSERPNCRCSKPGCPRPTRRLPIGLLAVKRDLIITRERRRCRLMTPLVVLKLNPGGRPLGGETERRICARDGETERLAEKRNGAQRARDDGRRVGTAAAKLFVGYKQVLGMICFDWLGAIPIKMRLRLAAVLKIFHFDVVARAGLAARWRWSIP